MSSNPPAKVTLSYPLYGVDFDPRNHDFLLVGGGGGEGRSGVGNKITLLDASKPDELSEVVEVELSKNEDSVTSLGIAYSSNSAIVAFAGINSSEQDQVAGRNEHLRSFRLEYPPHKAAAQAEKDAQYKGKTEALSKTSFFQTSTATRKETYQRVLRLSPWSEDQQQRIAAISTGLAPEGEIVLFRAQKSPSVSDELGRISLGRDEAADMDIRPQDSEGNYLLAYCIDDKVYTYKASGTRSMPSATPAMVYLKAESRPYKFRSLRFLTPRHILLLRNRPKRLGADLLIIQLGESASEAQLILYKRLHKSIKAAVALDVCVLSSSPSGERQIVVAVASQDTSIQILTIEYSPESGHKTFKSYQILRATHPASITALRFSNCIQPSTSTTPESRKQVVKLASTSVSQTVVVHSLPLQPIISTKDKTTRYILKPPGSSEAVQLTFSAFMAILVVGIVAFLLQAFTEIRGGVPPTLGATEWLSPRLRELVARPYMLSNSGLDSLPIIPTAAVSAVSSASSLLSDLLNLPSQSETAGLPSPADKAIIVRDSGSSEVSAELHPLGQPDKSTVEKENLKRYEELNEKQKEGWKRRLVDAGHWAESQGEAILTGVFFSELGGMVGDIVRGN